MGKTRLEIVQRLQRECGINPAVSTTLNQSGEFLMLIDWVDDVYEEVQNKHADWKFMREEFTASLSSGTAEYTPTAAGITSPSLDTWLVDDVRCYLTASGTADEQTLPYVPWEDYKVTYNFGTARTDTGRPSVFSVKPDNSIIVWPVPDAAYSLSGEYFRVNDEFTADADEPIFPDKFHMILMWGALSLYGASYVEQDKYVHGYNQYKKLLHAMERSERDQAIWSDPLA